MSDNTALGQAQVLREEAQARLRGMFGVPEGEHNGVIDRIVECIVGSAVLEMTHIINQSFEESVSHGASDSSKKSE